MWSRVARLYPGSWHPRTDLLPQLFGKKKNAELRKTEIVCLEMDENRESGKRKERSSRCHLFAGLVSLVTWLARISAVVFNGGGHGISARVGMMVI